MNQRSGRLESVGIIVGAWSLSTLWLGVKLEDICQTVKGKRWAVFRGGLNTQPELYVFMGHTNNNQ